MIKKIFSLVIFILIINVASAQKKSIIYHKNWIDLNKNGRMDVYENPNAKIEDRIQDLLSQMTVDEKTNQLATLYGYKRVLEDSIPMPGWKNEIWKDGIANIDEFNNGIIRSSKSFSNFATFPFSKHADVVNITQKWFIEETRLGIPVDFTNEGIHGLNHTKATPLPAPIGIGSTWNKALVLKAGEIVGREAKALGYTNVYAPILDLPRDPRWGRVLECYSEDPFLTTELGKQMVLGIQSQGVASTLKHFAVYSVPKGGRDGMARTDPHVSPRELHELFLYPFKRIIKEAYPMGIMSSYNDYDGVPVTGSHYFLTELLREKFGFTGYVVSDSRAVEYLETKHHVSATYKDAIKQVIDAGLNVRTNFSPPKDFILPLRELVNEGRISQEILNSRVADVLRVKFQLGLFDVPYVDANTADKIVGADKNQDFVLDIQKQSLVLLKNAALTKDGKKLLPIDKSAIKNILVTGPLAMETNYANSRYGPNQLINTSVLQGIQNYLGNSVKVNYAKGCDVIDATWPESEIIYTPLTEKEKSDIDKAVEEAKKNDIIIAVLGEDDDLTGESKSRTSLELPGRQQQLLQALYATGKPVVLVLINGQPLTINWANRYIPSILEAWFPAQLGGKAIAETLFGDYNPGGKLSITFPKTTGQIELNFPFKPGSQANQQSSGDNGYGNTRVNGALYPFGYGLSYTIFEYSNLTVTPLAQKTQGEIMITVNVKNTGKIMGDEVVQLYISDKVSSVTVYESQLRGFERVNLQPGQTKTVTFKIGAKDLEMLDKNMNWTVEPGDFEVRIGASSEDIKLKQTFAVVE
ncbi:beta-glucosidase [Pedobacter changchengzhani]|uniref:Beta-glucosidase n=1 Tax=Pedobacter changchengzhani TaxID=2529274 RepID=A0A4R5MKI7_9SPHI|nr:glycoside hydrolase family 3 N-terminal domain-containing protein [Pedobacter changchengzhani]TDG36180.1 beta-glucosidase [Pedobacter changchengzhani]